MSETKQEHYLMQRFQILSLFANHQMEQNVTPAYAFAWDKGVYPCLNDNAPWHKPYEECFEIKESRLRELLDFLCDRRDSKKTISFHELEDHFAASSSVRSGDVWSRHELLIACRYMDLLGFFDSEFLAALLENGESPLEAQCIGKEYRPEEVEFV